ncbi:DUF1275 domain-containing protein [Rhodococcus fascians]|nr:DUF1275 domain-containing protein [Rhodococcus fascians]MBY4139204.1 DUF1275 domain-containing protein [Rhodococcus fascians]MBY4217671.1 DUF1275 domain-containing protein [Rhodococcus fascians]MBY4224591.1 DUF1275 domain-containing protein [Rhodococcus fascians]MBY4233741.1 DUF1275 domain-containing protein [Rhodococcus fascians]
MNTKESVLRSRVPLWSMQTLTFSTGIADAVGYLGLDKVFTGNMTGNVVILGMASGNADELPILGPAVALAMFMFGAALGGRLLRHANGWWPRALSVLLAAVSAVLWITVACLAFLPSGGNHLIIVVIAGSVAMAMGAQAAGARFLAVKDVTTVVITSTITGLAADSWLGGRKNQPWRRRLTSILLIGVGALVGALTMNVGAWLGMAIAACISTGVVVSAHIIATRAPTDKTEAAQAH